jgi:hypothetical protein
VDMTPERTLRAAVYRGDGAAAMTVLTGAGRGLLQSMPQLAGDGLLCALAHQLPAAQHIASQDSSAKWVQSCDTGIGKATKISPINLTRPLLSRATLLFSRCLPISNNSRRSSRVTHATAAVVST